MVMNKDLKSYEINKNVVYINKTNYKAKLFPFGSKFVSNKF